MAVYSLPLRQDAPHFSFELELELKTYIFEFRWNDRAAGWYMTIYDGSGTVLLAGRRVVVGFPLLYRFADPRLPPGYLEALDSSGAGEDPGLGELGGRVKILYYESTTTAADVEGAA